MGRLLRTLAAVALIVAVTPAALAQDNTQAGDAAAAGKAEPVRASGLLLEANLGVPKAESNAFSVDVGGAVGYATDTVALAGYGRRATLDSQLDGRDLLDVRTTAGLRATYAFGGAGAPLRVVAGLDAAFGQYFTSTTVLDGSATTSDEVSQTVRGLATLGGLWIPTAAASVLVDGALGFQREAYQQEVVVPAGVGAGAYQQDQSSGTLVYRARVQTIWRAVPGILRLSALGRAEGFSLTRSQADFSYVIGQSYRSQSAVTRSSRLEVVARLAAEIDALEFVGVRPGVYAQIEHVRSSGAGAAVAVNVPSAGLLLRSELPF